MLRYVVLPPVTVCRVNVTVRRITVRRIPPFTVRRKAGTRLLFHKDLMLDIRGFPPLRVRRAPNQEGERVPKRAAEEENIYD